LHELPDQLAIMRALTRFSARIERAEDACATVRSAFSAMLTGRPRPVAVEVPLDVWKKSADVAFSSAPVEVVRPRLDVNAINRAAALIGTARRPIIFAGGGALPAELQATRRAAPGSSRGEPSRARCNRRSTRPGDHRTGRAGCGRIAISPVGSDAARPPLQLWGRDAGLKVIRVDLDVEEMNRFGAPDIAIHADVRDALPALVSALHAQPAAPNRSNEIAAIKRTVIGEISSVLAPQARWLAAIRAALPDDGIYIDELTQVGYVGRLIYSAHAPRTYIASGYQGTLGWGYATALGVKMARPNNRWY
jgi:acetolactate synthase-1/2/3 large subunit